MITRTKRLVHIMRLGMRKKNSKKDMTVLQYNTYMQKHVKTAHFYQ